MKVAVFLTYNYSLQTWHNSGTLKRELEIYNQISNINNTEFTFYTYGDSEDIELIKNFPNFNVVPMFKKHTTKSKLYKFVYSLFIPVLYGKNIANEDILHQHQLLGSWVVVISKLIYSKKILIRTGYDMYEFSILNNEGLIRKFLLNCLTYISLKFSDIYTTTSREDIKFLKSNYKINHEKIKLRPNWIIDNNFKTIDSRKSNEIISVGRLDKQKNYRKLISLFTKDSDFSLKIIGSGPENKELKELIRNNELKVSIVDNLNNEDIKKEMNNYKYYLSSSKFEGNPKTILEAMSTGCIVIASNIKNHREIIDNNKTGFLYDLDSPVIFEILNKLEDSSSLQEKISTNALNAVLKTNDISIISKEMSEDYKFLLK
tara:strand:+ start:125 stop:1246 length:1122 start_codon:yes stop_codon:yes gene_type:complete